MRNVAILTGPDTHLDHLGVLSAVLDIPLIVTDERNLLLSQEFYPDLKAQLMGLDELTMEHLACNYDTLFETGKFFAAQLKPFIQLLFGKTMRFVFCPHGNSDKGHSLGQHVDQDISLVYGDHLHDLLQKNGAAKQIRHIVRTGNYRYPYYLKHKPFFDALAQKKVFSRFQVEKPTILYAPTWNDRENPTSFFEHTDRIIQELSNSYNLLIKLHPFLIEDHPAHTYHIMARYEDHPGVVFLTDFPPIYPLLARCDLYLGDYSSIGYDFLAFDKPLYFFNHSAVSPLQTCGLTIPSEGASEKFLTSSIKECSTRFSEQRKKVYNHAFGKEISPELIRRQLISLKI